MSIFSEDKILKAKRIGLRLPYPKEALSACKGIVFAALAYAVIIGYFKNMPAIVAYMEGMAPALGFFKGLVVNLPKHMQYVMAETPERAMYVEHTMPMMVVFTIASLLIALKFFRPVYCLLLAHKIHEKNTPELEKIFFKQSRSILILSLFLVIGLPAVFMATPSQRPTIIVSRPATIDLPILSQAVFGPLSMFGFLNVGAYLAASLAVRRK